MNPALSGLLYSELTSGRSCLFEAVAVYLGINLDELRYKVAALMQKEGDSIDNNLRVACVRGGNEAGNQLERMAIQAITGSPIIIINSAKNLKPIPTCDDDVNSYENIPIFVYYHSEGGLYMTGHYDAFTLQKGADPRIILANIQQEMQLGNTVTFDAPLSKKKPVTSERDSIKVQVKSSSATQARYTTLGPDYNPFFALFSCCNERSKQNKQVSPKS